MFTPEYILGRMVVHFAADATKFTQATHAMDNELSRLVASVATKAIAIERALSAPFDISAFKAKLMGFTNALNLTNFNNVIRLGVLQTAQGIRSVISLTNQAVNSFRSLGASFTSYATIPMGLMGLGGLRAFGHFDEGITHTMAIMDGFDANIRRNMENISLSISGRSITPAKDLAAGFLDLTRAGWSAEQSMASMAQIERFAVAGMMPLNEAIRVVTTSQRALGMTSDNLQEHLENNQRLMEIIATAGTFAGVSMGDFAESLTHKASTALRFYNRDLEEGAAVLAAYNQAGVRGPAAGERMALMYRDLTGAAVNNAVAWRQYGIQAFDPITHRMLKVGSIMEQLENQFARRGIGTDSHRAELRRLGFPDRSVAATMPLVGRSGEIQEFEERFRNVNGVIERIASINLTSFNAQLKNLWNNVVNAGIGIGKILAPWIEKLNNGIKSGVEWWNKLSDPVKQTLVLFGGLLVIAGPLMLVLGGIFSLLMGMVLNPISSLLKIGVLGTLLAGLARWIGGNGGLGESWLIAKDYMKEFFDNAVGFMHNFQENFTVLTSWIGETWSNLWEHLGEQMAAALFASVENVKNIIATMIGNLWESIQRGPQATTNVHAVGNLLAAANRRVEEIMRANLLHPGVVTQEQAVSNVQQFLREHAPPGVTIGSILSGGTHRPFTLGGTGFGNASASTINEVIRALGEGGVQGRINRDRINAMTAQHVTTQEMLRLMGWGGLGAIGPPKFNYHIPQQPLNQNNYTSANAAGLLGIGGDPYSAMIRSVMFRTPSFREQGVNAAGIVAALSDPLTGLLRAGTAKFDLSGRRNRYGDPYDEGGEGVTAPQIGRFQQIELRRFMLEGPGGLVNTPQAGQIVRDTETHRRLDEIITNTSIARPGAQHNIHDHPSLSTGHPGALIRPHGSGRP